LSKRGVKFPLDGSRFVVSSAPMQTNTPRSAGNNHVERLMEELKTAIRRSKRSQRAIEAELGWGRGYLSQIFTGRIELKASMIFAVLEVLGVEPGEFFAAIYPVTRLGGEDDPEELIRSKVIQGLGQAVAEHDKEFAAIHEKLDAVMQRIEAISGGGEAPMKDRARGPRR
jgi:transcriptional regulator with XRE-family HTH domain